MTDKLREAAQQALKALAQYQLEETEANGAIRICCSTRQSEEHTHHCVAAEAVTALRAALAQQDAQAVNRGYDPGFITRLATLVDKETKQILEDSLSLIEQIKYMVGIAERGTGKKCPADERPEIFLLDYVKSLEAALARQDAQAVPVVWMGKMDFETLKSRGRVTATLYGEPVGNKTNEVGLCLATPTPPRRRNNHG